MIGTGNSGHDIAQDLYSSGAEVTLVAAQPDAVTNIEPSAQLAYAAYNEGTLEDNDLIATSMPLQLARKSHVMITEQSKEAGPGTARRAHAHRLQARLRRRQHRLAVQIPHPRRRLLFQRRLLRSGRQRRDQADPVCGYRRLRRRRRADEEWRDACRRPDRAGDRLQAAGRSGAQAVRRGGRRRASARSGVSARARNCATCTPARAQPGLWFIAGSLAQCRINSKYLALQIKAIEEGLLPRGARSAAPTRPSHELQNRHSGAREARARNP